MRSKISHLVLFAAFGLWVSACGSSGSQDSSSPPPKLKPVIAPHVQLVPTKTSDQALVFGDRVEFPAAGNDQILHLRPGQILVGRRQSTKEGHNPYGFLRTVSSVKKQGDVIVVVTDHASLEDAIEQGEAQVAKKISMPSRFEEGARTLQLHGFSSPGLQPKDTGGAAGGKIDISGSVLPGLGAGVNASLTRGMFFFDPNIDVRIKFEHHRLQHFHAYFTGNLQAELAFKLEGRVTSTPKWQSYEAEVYKVDRPLPILWVGWLPVEVTMVVKVSVGAEVQVAHKFSVEAGGGIKGHVKLGGSYDAATDWTGVGEAPLTPYAIGPNFAYKAELEAKVQAPIVSIEFLIYDAAGPALEVSPYAKVHGEITPPCAWDLSVGSEGEFVGKAQIPIIGKDIGELHLKLFDFEHKLKEGHFPGCRQPDAGPDAGPDAAGGGGGGGGWDPDGGTSSDGGVSSDSGTDAAPDAGNTCANLAEKRGWKHPFCETGGNGACKGHGPATSDCEHCCEGTSCEQLGREKGWKDLHCDRGDGKGPTCGKFGVATWDCDSCCGSTCIDQGDCKDGTVCATAGWGYCCQKPGAEGEPCYSSSECDANRGEVCAFNGEKFVCTVPQCVDMKASK